MKDDGLKFYGVRVLSTTRIMVFVQAESAEAIDDATVEAALAEVEADEWVEDEVCEYLPPIEAPSAYALQYGYVTAGAQPADTGRRETIEARAARIGVTPRTLLSWKARGIAIHDDAAVREHVAMMRSIPRQIAPEFKPRLRQ